MLRISFLLMAFGLISGGEGSLMVPAVMEGTEILDKRGAALPKDILLTNHLGQPVKLGDYLGKKPLILILGYNKCPMLCNLVINGTIEAIKGQSLKLGRDFEILSVSVNPKETPDLAHSRRTNYLKSLNAPENSAFDFLLGSEDQIKRLADTVGFGYKFHKPSGEYIHSAGIFIISPDGTLSRTLYGISYKAADLKMSLIDASNGKIGSILDRIILSCFHYEPDSHKYGVYVFGVMRLGGLLTILILGAAVFMMWKREV
ncbi:MAG: SCO family protein [Myxococcaceae bacterium]